MAYSEANPPRLVEQDIGNTDQAEWLYSSADALATVRAANYITNAARLGMKVGDLVRVRVTGTSPAVVSLMTVVAVAAAGADLTDGTPLSVVNT